MTKNIKFRVEFTDHTNKTINLNNYITEVENGSMIYELNKGYVNLDFVTNGVFYDPSIIGDDTERVKVKFKLNDNDIQEELFCIEAVEYLTENNIKVYCRSKSYKFEKYTLNNVISGKDLKEVITSLFSGLNVNFDNFTPLAFNGSLEVKNKSAFDLLNELQSFYKFEYYYRQGVLYIEDKKAIKKEDVALQRFSEIQDIESLSTSTDLFKKKIKRIDFNIESESIDKELPALKLDIRPDPQPTSPDSVLNYTDDNNNTYKMSPKKATFTIYFSPFIGSYPECNLTTQTKEKTIIEKYTLNNESFLRVTAHIKELLGVEGVENYTYDLNDNIIMFGEKISGEVKISYKTNVLIGVIENSKYPKNILVKASYLDREINYNHKIELNEYYPIPYNLILNTISDWGLNADESINKSITVSKFDSDTKAFTEMSNISSDEFGDFTIHIEAYNTYRFDMTNQEPLFLDYYVNKKEIYMNEVSC